MMARLTYHISMFSLPPLGERFLHHMARGAEFRFILGIAIITICGCSPEKCDCKNQEKYKPFRLFYELLDKIGYFFNPLLHFLYLSRILLRSKTVLQFIL